MSTVDIMGGGIHKKSTDGKEHKAVLKYNVNIYTISQCVASAAYFFVCCSKSQLRIHGMFKALCASGSFRLTVTKRTQSLIGTLTQTSIFVPHPSETYCTYKPHQSIVT